jgi:hypothetical protein
MNERLKQLAVDSKLGSAEFGNGIQYYVATQETFQKFAESIVRDIYAYVDGLDTAQIISNGILKRYGMEE